jgi:hypothetical protein
MSEHLDRLSLAYSETIWNIYELLDRSLDPRGPDWLHTLAAEYIPRGGRILDAGCRDAEHLIRLVKTHDARGVGVDPVAIHVDRARDAVRAAGLEARIQIVHGGMEALPDETASFDFVWCRDVLEQVKPLDAALSELARVADGPILVYTMFATDRMTVEERALLGRHLGNLSPNLEESRVENAFASAGLRVERKVVVGTEFKEYTEERRQPGSRTLLRLARLERLRGELARDHGSDVVDHITANLYWELFGYLGKLQPMVYILGGQRAARYR